MIKKTDPASGELRVVFAGGGTGGHLYPAVAIAEAFAQQHQNVRVHFIGTARGLEARVIPRLGYPLTLVPVRGLERRLTWRNLLVPMRLLQSIRQCSSLFRSFQPHLVVGTGGYVSGPALLAARLTRRMFVIQEQNSFPGMVNRTFGKQAHAVFLSFEESRKFFTGHKNVHVVGNPVRTGLKSITPAHRQAGLEKWRLDKNRITLLVFGGSQGARRINDVIIEVLPRLAEIENLQMLWATGPAHFDKIAPIANAHPQVRAVPYLDEMDLAYALADFAICRSGASTIFELALCGVPAILVPFPFATADHQTFNARAWEAAGAAHVFVEKDLRVDNLLACLRALASDQEKRGRMSQAAQKLARPNAAEEIVKACMELLDAPA